MCKYMYIRMLGKLLLGEFEYLLIAIITISMIFYIIYLLIGDDISKDDNDDIDLGP